MNSDLKKVGLVFKADGTTDFMKSLQTINANLKENYSQFKLVQEQWDKSTSNSQKLRDKLDYLNKAYDSQREKVNLLKTELKELENAEERNEQAIQKKKTQLIQAETKLANYNNRIKETTLELNTATSALVKYGDSFKNAGEKMQQAGNKIKKFSLIASGGLIASTKTAIDFEDAFTGVMKTVDATDEEFKVLRQGIIDMSKELPTSTTEISAVAEAAGQLGIQKENILGFTRTMIDLGESTNLSANEAADALARFANITGMSQKNFDRLGSVIVDLGNNCATTESEIVDMSLRIAGAGKTIGMSEAEIMSFAAALSSVGIEAEMGGSAMSKMMINIESAVATSSESLERYAEVSGMTAQEFKQSWEKDATGAMIKFIEGLGNVEKNGGNLITTLEDLDISEVRLRDTMLRLANSSEKFTDTVILGNQAWDENNALSEEAAKRYATLKSKLEIVLNKVKATAITLGTKMMPTAEKVVDTIGKWIDKFDKLDDKQADLIIKVGLIVAALAPLLKAGGKIVTGVGNVMTILGNLNARLKSSRSAISATENSVNGLSTVFHAVTSPIGIACTGIAASIALIYAESKKSSEKIKETFNKMGTSAINFLNGIQTAESHLSSFNSTLFATNEEQQELSNNMDEIQKGITEIVKKASDERRNYTDDEITKLDEYFQKLRETKNRELAIQQEIANAITQQAITSSETFEGSLEEYKVLSQEWLNTAQQQADIEISLIEQRTIEEIALLNQRYREKATLENEEYAREYNAIIANKETAIKEANDEVARIGEIYSNGYTNRGLQNDEFLAKLKENYSLIEEESNRHSQKLQDIENSSIKNSEIKQQLSEAVNLQHIMNMRGIWEELYKDMDKSEAEQLGSWLAMVSQTELYGGKIDEETKKIVNSIIDSYDSMSEDTRKVMKQVMDPMLDEMKNSEPSLYAKASGIANGIISRLKKSFDIHSPSRVTRGIFRNVMKGSEIGIEDEEKNLYNQTEKIAKNVQDKFEDINPQLDLESGSYNMNRLPGYQNSNIITLEIDYNRLTKSIIKALNLCSLTLDRDGFVKFIENVVSEVI